MEFRLAATSNVGAGRGFTMSDAIKIGRDGGPALAGLDSAAWPKPETSGEEIRINGGSNMKQQHETLYPYF